MTPPSAHQGSLQVQTYFAYRQATRALSQHTSSPSDDLNHCLSTIFQKYGLQSDDESQKLLSSSFMNILDASQHFLEKCRAFEKDTRILLRTKSTPPLYHHLRINAVSQCSLNESQRASFESLRDAEIRKCNEVLACYRIAETILMKNLSSAKAMEKRHHLVGSIIRRVIQHIRQFDQAEITISPNIQLQLKILTRPTPNAAPNPPSLQYL